MAWDAITADQNAGLAVFHLHECKKQAAKSGTEAIQMDPSMQPTVNALLGSLIQSQKPHPSRVRESPYFAAIIPVLRA